MHYATEKGTIIQSIRYKDYDCIITLFSGNGVSSFLVKGAFSSKLGKGASTEPLVQVEILYQKKTGSLPIAKEITVLDRRASLRSRLSSLEAACDIAKAVYSTQMPGKPAPELYDLFTAYIKKIPVFDDPYILAASFRLKLLHYENLFDTELINRTIDLDEEARHTIAILSNAKTFGELSKMILTGELRKKIWLLFEIGKSV